LVLISIVYLVLGFSRNQLIETAVLLGFVKFHNRLYIKWGSFKNSYKAHRTVVFNNMSWHHNIEH